MMKVFLFFMYVGGINSQETLRFLQVWFRHGERLPTHYLQMPNEPLRMDYLELGEGGELTNRGIQQEFLLGQLLKKTYGDFLGEYSPSQIHTFTGVDNRTVASAQALFAGLFPPTERRIWNKNLLWQPVAMQTEDSIDWVSTGIEDACPTYEKNLFGSAEYKAIPGQLDQAVLSYLKNVTGGAPLEDVQQINHLIDSLVCRVALNDTRLSFPIWAEPVRDRLDPLHYNIHDKVLNLQNKTIGGYHIEKVLAYIEDHLQRAPAKKNKGVFLAAHDTNLMALGKAFNLQKIPKPKFGAHLIVELHEISGVNVVKFLYGNGVGSEVVEVKAEFCGIPCTLTRLQELAEGHRTSEAEMLKACKNFGPLEGPNPFVTGVLIALTAIFLLTTIIFGCTSHNYKKQLRELSDPERTHLLR